MRYVKELDSLRAIAVLLVIVHHWLPSDSFINRLPNGEIGVNVFFVLSGFLISKILFDNRIEAESEGVSRSVLIKNFYIRRALRIFPIYYLTIFALLIFHKYTDTTIQSSFLYFLTYTSNFYFVKIHAWDGMLSHLWSLAVEEQFYLIWPWLVLLIDKKFLLPLITCFILTGIISQYFVSELITFTCFDAFGLGALLAWLLTFRSGSISKFYFVSCVFAVVSIVLMYIALSTNLWILPLRTTISLIAVWIISYIVLNRSSHKFKFVLNNRVLLFLGKISYGIYLYHNIIPTFNWKFIEKYYNPMTHDFILKEYWLELFWIENGVLLLVVSWLSYIFVEKRFLYLKKYFEYQNKDSVTAGTAAVTVVERAG